MRNYAVYFVLVINLVLINHSNQQSSQLVSPCPNVFQYQFDGSSYNGIITAPSPPLDKREVVLQLSLSLRGSTTVSFFFFYVPPEYIPVNPLFFFYSTVL